jgi:hypothetical protein
MGMTNIIPKHWFFPGYITNSTHNRIFFCCLKIAREIKTIAIHNKFIFNTTNIFYSKKAQKKLI